MPLDPDAPGTIRLTVAEAEALAVRALSAIGLTADEVARVAPHLIDAALCGYAYAGLPRILALAAAPDLRKPRSPPRI